MGTIRRMYFTRSLSACLFSSLLIACGESDLVILQQEEMAGEGGSVQSDPLESNAVDLNLYDMVFSDEFDGDTIDSSKWSTALAWGPDVVVYDQLQYFVDLQNEPDFGFNPFSLDGDVLTINAMKTPDGLRAAANDQLWMSGALTTADKFDFTYGYVETRIEPQEGQGVWPALLMLGSEYTGLKPEIFIMEYNGSEPDSLFHNYNYENADGELKSPGQWQLRSDALLEGFHTVGLEWSPSVLLFYIDGEPSYQVKSDNISSQNMYLILQLAMGGIWAGAPDETTPSPSAIAIDYVRVYQLKD